MTETPQGPKPEGRRPISLIWIANGLLIFLAINFLILIVGLDAASLTVGLLYTAAVILLGSLLYFLLDWRAFALGFAGGFVLLTIISGGVCTLFVPL